MIPKIQLLASPAYVRKITDIGRGVDEEKLVPAMILAQDKHIQLYLGTKLYERVKTDAENMGDAEADYVLLIDTYVRRAVVWWTVVELLPELYTQVDNAGVVHRSADRSETTEATQFNLKLERARQNAHFYTERLITYLQNNNERYNEYTSNLDEDIRPEPRVYYQSGMSISGQRDLRDSTLSDVIFPLS